MKNLKKILIVAFLIALVVLEIVQAISVTNLGGGRYLINLSDNRTAIAYNVNWNNKEKLLSFSINTSDGRGLKLQDLLEMRAYAETLVGRANHLDKTTVVIR